MSETYDCIVLGVGGFGSGVFYHLAKHGVRVLGIEQFGIAHDRGSSHGETRIIRKAYFEHPNYVPLAIRASIFGGSWKRNRASISCSSQASSWPVLRRAKPSAEPKFPQISMACTWKSFPLKKPRQNSRDSILPRGSPPCTNPMRGICSWNAACKRTSNKRGARRSAQNK